MSLFSSDESTDIDNSDVELRGLLNVENNKYIKEHSIILKESINVAKAFIISSSIGFCSETMMLTVWILFAKTMNDCTDNIITMLVFLQSILQIVGILCTSYLSDKYGFDLITIYTSTLLLISALLHSISYSIITLGIGVLLKGFVMDDIEILSLGFIAKLLPLNEASIYTGYWYTFTAFTSLLGTLFGGILASYTVLSYRLVFVISFIIILIRWIYILFKIRNTQKNLINKQLKFTKYYLQQKQNLQISEIGNNNDINNLTELEKTWFPSCLEKIGRSNNNKENDSINNNMINMYTYIELILNIIEFSFISCFINVTSQFIAIYMFDRFNLSIFKTQTFVVLGIITFCVTTFLMPDYVQKLTLIKRYLIIIPLLISLICIFMLLIPQTTYKYIYLFWFWWFLLSISMGCVFIISEICILELQPKQHTGKINGIKTALRYITVGILSSLIAYFWNTGTQYAAFPYFQGSAYIIALVINMCLIFFYVFKHAVHSIKAILNANIV